MATMTLEDFGSAAATAPQVRPGRRLRPGRDAYRGLRPTARPPRVDFAPAPVRGAGVRSCTVARPAVVAVPAAAAGSWRLTERGIALVVLTFALIAVAAVAVVGLTALRVTSDSYQPYGQSVLAR